MKYYSIKKIKSFTILIFLFISIWQTSCKKYLEERPSKSLVIPSNVKELQGLLDGGSMYTFYPSEGHIADDNFFISNNVFASISAEESRTYLWDPAAGISLDWERSYFRIFNANIVLQEIDKLTDKVSTQEEYDNVKGSALFYRAANYYELAQLFAPPYSLQSATTQFGIPLKETGNIDEPTKRSTVQETYDKIIADLQTSVHLLPSVIKYRTRPGKAAAYALLARTFLVMNKYDSAGKYADLCLQNYNSLLDFNIDINTSEKFPFQILNPEVIWHAACRDGNFFFPYTTVDSVLYNSYDNNDLRKIAFYRDNGDGTYTFKGNYNNAFANQLFSGITTAEAYLILSESLAREGDIAGAMKSLNLVMYKRWRVGTFIPFSAGSQSEAIHKILLERRKELAFRPNLRWSDLRRLNLDNDYAITIKRIINNEVYQLPPNDLRYTFIIPESVVNKSGIQQNPR